MELKMSELQQIIRAQLAMEEHMQSMDDKLDVCVILLSGTPADPQKGLIVRFDRVEQMVRRRNKLMWILTGGVVTLIFGKAAALLGF